MYLFSLEVYKKVGISRVELSIEKGKENCQLGIEKGLTDVPDGLFKHLYW